MPLKTVATAAVIAALTVATALPAPAGAQSDTGAADTGSGSDRAPASARVLCEDASEIFYVLCAVYESIVTMYVDPVSAASLADAAVRGLMEADLEPSSAPGLACALPDPEFERVCERIDETTNTARAVWVASKRMVASLGDGRSVLLPPKFHWVVESEPDVRSGLGLVLSLMDGDDACPEMSGTCRLVIADVYPGSPAAMAGLMAEDVVLELNGPLPTGLSCRKASQLDAFDTGAVVRVKASRAGVVFVEDVRAAALEVPVARGRVVDDGIGYLRLSTFSDNAPSELLSALRGLLDAGAGRLVLDLRGNLGGSFNASLGVAGMFLSDDSIVVRTTGRTLRTQYATEGWEIASDPVELPMAVAVDGHSASASELVTGALADHGRATVVGGTTYGKGTAQLNSLLTTPDGKVHGVLVLTTARWSTPLDRSPAGGFAPDAELALPPCLHPDEVTRRASAAIRPRVAEMAVTSRPANGRAYEPDEIVTLTVSFTTPVFVDAADGAPTFGLRITDRTRRAVYHPAAPGNVSEDSEALAFQYTITAEDASRSTADGDCTTDADAHHTGDTADPTASGTGANRVYPSEIGFDADALDAGDATIRNAAGLNAVLTHDARPPAASNEAPARFIDIARCAHRESIELIAAAGITLGCNPPANDRFCPDRTITRAEAAGFLARALELPEASDDYFADDDGSVHEDSINRLAQAGIALGCAPDSNRVFCPQRRVSRAQIASFLARALKLEEPAGAPSGFIDIAHSPHRSAIERLAASDAAPACNPPADDRFCPDRTITRAEMADLLVGAVNRLRD